MIPPKILNLLSSGESIIYERSGGFDFEGKSVVGTHTLYIASSGKIHVHDTGGLFGSEQVKTYQAPTNKIELIFSGYLARMRSTSSFPLRHTFLSNRR